MNTKSKRQRVRGEVGGSDILGTPVPKTDKTSGNRGVVDLVMDGVQLGVIYE